MYKLKEQVDYESFNNFKIKLRQDGFIEIQEIQNKYPYITIIENDYKILKLYFGVERMFCPFDIGNIIEEFRKNKNILNF